MSIFLLFANRNLELLGLDSFKEFYYPISDHIITIMDKED